MVLKKILKKEKNGGYYEYYKVKGIKKFGDELKCKICKNVLFSGLHMSHERIQSKYNVWTYRINKNIYLKMDTIDYHILVNELVNHTKLISSSIDNLFCYSV